VVRFIVINNKVVDLTILQHRLYLEEVFLQEIGLHRVDQCDLLINDEVGVIGNAIRQFHVVLKHVGVAVVDADVIDVFG
jgi:hypothetical protein